MKKLIVMAALAGGLGFLSAHSAVANQWEAELESMSLAPGALLPTFTPICQATLGDDEDGTYDSDEDCSNEAIAQWLAEWFGVLEVDQLEGILADLDVDFGIPAEELINADPETLLAMVSQQEDYVLAELCETKVQAKPCKSKTMGVCTVGRKCWGPCTDKNGKAGNCTWKSRVEANPLWWWCPGGRQTIYSCTNPCPVPAWAMLLGAVSATGAFAGRRRKSGPVSKS